MSTEISRRDFIKIAFGAVSAAVLSDSALAQLLPPGVTDLPVNPAYPIGIDPSGYLYDPTFDYTLPTYREMLSNDLGLDALSEDEQLKRFAEWLGNYDPEEMEDCGLSLGDQVDPEDCSPHWLSENSEWRAGLELHEQLGCEARERLGLVLIAGEHPGSNFVAVRCDKPEVLQEALLREGINVEVG